MSRKHQKASLITRPVAPALPVRQEYDQHGATGFYSHRGDHYQNPHEPIIWRLLAEANTRWQLPLQRVLDLGCGTGEATLGLQACGANELIGCDPYLAQRYRQRTGNVAWEQSFESISAGALSGETFSLVVCSFALHLMAPSRLPALLVRLAECTAALLIITPHKRPQISAELGWQLHGEIMQDRVRARYYRCTLHDNQ